MLLEEGAAFSTDRHRGVLLADGTLNSLGDRGGDRVNARGGEDDGGFGAAGGLVGFKLGDLGVSLGKSDFEFLNLLVLGADSTLAASSSADTSTTEASTVLRRSSRSAVRETTAASAALKRSSIVIYYCGGGKVKRFARKPLGLRQRMRLGR